MFDPTPPVGEEIVGNVFDRDSGGSCATTFELDPLLYAELEVLMEPIFDDVVIGII